MDIGLPAELIRMATSHFCVTYFHLLPALLSGGSNFLAFSFEEDKPCNLMQFLLQAS
jgi:hypothetical protein